MRRLLVVEDDARLRDELCVLLERNGYEAVALTSFGPQPARCRRPVRLPGGPPPLRRAHRRGDLA